jgi:hypothetical protein
LVSHIEVGIYAENRVLTKISGPKRDKIRGEWRRQHNVELRNRCSSTTIIWVNESRRMRWKGHVAHMGVRRGTYRVSMGRSQQNRTLGRARHRWEDNIKMDLQGVGWEGMDWTYLAQDRDRWQVLVNAVMSLWVP